MTAARRSQLPSSASWSAAVAATSESYAEPPATARAGNDDRKARKAAAVKRRYGCGKRTSRNSRTRSPAARCGGGRRGQDEDVPHAPGPMRGGARAPCAPAGGGAPVPGGGGGAAETGV